MKCSKDETVVNKIDLTSNMGPDIKLRKKLCCVLNVFQTYYANEKGEKEENENNLAYQHYVSQIRLVEHSDF